MNRQWTDPRDGRSWRVSCIGTGGGDHISADDPPAVLFTSNGETHTLPTDRACELSNLSASRLQTLLDAARGTDRSGPRDTSAGSPNASGRESAPHVDLGRAGPGGGAGDDA